MNKFLSDKKLALNRFIDRYIDKIRYYFKCIIVQKSKIISNKIISIVLSKTSIYIFSPLISIIFYIIIYNINFGIFPDVFYLSKNNNITAYFGTILSCISSILALLIAIILIAFEFYKSNLKHIYLKYFIENSSLVWLVNIYTYVFIFSALSLMLFSNNYPSSNGEITISYLSIISFIILFPLTFIFSFRLVKNLNINHIIDEYLNKLSFEEIFLIDSQNKIVEPEEFLSGELTLTDIVDRDSLNILQKLLMNQLRTENIVKAQIILLKVNDKFIKFIIDKYIIDNKSNTSLYQYRYAKYLLTIISDTKIDIKLVNALILDRSLELVSEFYEVYNKNKLLLSEIEYFREAFYSKLLKTYQNDTESIIKILKSISTLINTTINTNLPPESDILYLNHGYSKNNDKSLNSQRSNESHNNSYSWGKFIDNYPKYFLDEMYNSIRNNDEKIYFDILNLYYRLAFNWSWGQDADIKHLKSRWIITIYANLIMVHRAAIERGIVYKIQSIDILSSMELFDLFEKNEICARRILVDYLHFVIWLNSKGKLTYDIYSGIFLMGDFGKMYSSSSLTEFGVFFASNYNKNDDYKGGFEDIIATLEHLLNSYNAGIINPEFKITKFEEVIDELKLSYINANKNRAKSQIVIRRINKLKMEIKIIIQNK